MATSGSVTTNSAGDYSPSPDKLTLSWSRSSYSVGNNTSTIKWTLKSNGSSTYWTNSGPIRVWINGSKVYEKTGRFKMYGGKTIASGTSTISHNSDGTKSFTGKVEAAIWSSSVNCTASKSFTLDTIPRASSISGLSGDYLGNQISVSISRASGSFIHRVEYAFAGSGYTVISSAATNAVTWTPPLSLANSIPNSTSGTFTIRVTTFNGSTQIGSAVTKSITLYVPSSVVPTAKISLARVDNGVPSGWGVYVTGISKVTASASGSGSYGSTIKSYYISGPGISSSSSSATSGTLGTGTNTYTVTVTDSRGRSASKSASISIVSYSNPSISVSAQRCDRNGTVTSSGTYLRVVCSYSIASVSGKNSVASRSVSCNGASHTSFGNGAAIILAANCAINNTYTVTASVTDALGRSAIATYSIPTAHRIMNVRANKDGIAFGGFATRANTTQSYWPVESLKGYADKTYVNQYIHLDYGSSRKGGYLATWQRIDAHNIGLHSYSYSDFASEALNGLTVNTGYIRPNVNGNHAKIGAQNASYFHYMSYDGKHWFNKDVYVQGNIYGGSSYSRRLTYVDEVALKYNVGYFGAWIGFYVNNGATRRGWVGPNASTDFTIMNEAGGSTWLRAAGTYPAAVWLKPGTSTYKGGYFAPSGNGITTCGTASNRWFRLYQEYDSIDTSDERKKKDIQSIKELPKKYSEGNENILESLFTRLTPKIYKMNNPIENYKVHIGFIAQDISKELLDLGVDEEFFGIIDHSYWTDEETGEEKDEYGLAYSEFIALNTHMIQKCLSRINELEYKLKLYKEGEL